DSDSASTQKAFEADLLLVHTSPVRGATGGLVRRNHGDGSRSFTGIIGPPESSLGAFLVHGILREYIPACCPVKPVAPDHIRRGRSSDRLQGLAAVGAEVRISNPALGTDRSILSGRDGAYRIPGLSAGTYTISTSKAGFTTETFRNLELSVNCTFTLNIVLKVEGHAETVEVSTVSPLLERTTSSTGSTIGPRQIEQMPINGRNYLDLLQLVPGVSINRQQDASLDSATPILGERGGNTVFLIDGMPNRDELNGGAAVQFNQDSILEFQVITSGYEAEFGHGFGTIIYWLSKSGTND